MSNLKGLIRSTLWALHLDVTRNLKYDRLTWKVMKKILHSKSNCIDIGCHKGELLEWMLRLSPSGNHLAFEPIPELKKQLDLQFENKGVEIHEVALSKDSGTALFQLVKNAPAYSGFKQRTYAIADPEIEELSVQKRTLDSFLSPTRKIDLIKLDVEGAEYEVLEGARTLIKADKPSILFEFGLGAADHYGVKPNEMFELLQDLGLEVFTLSAFLKNEKSLSKEAFRTHFEANSEYYFLARPIQ